MRTLLAGAKRIVIKAGTSMLAAPQGWISETQLQGLGRQVTRIIHGKKQVVLVSSGAIAFGMQSRGIKKRPRIMAALQACAAIGQGKLMHAYEEFFSMNGIGTAQLLLTRDGLEDRRRFLAARRTFEELLAMGVLPIVNENDTVATEEIAFGDNDILSVHAAHLVHADCLILLSDVDGFFLKDGSRIREVSSEQDIDRELVKHLKDVPKERTVGGMKAKLEAARVAMRLGVPLIMVNGHEPDMIARVLAGEDVGTFFCAGKGRSNARKKWIAFSAARKGTLWVDKGAYRALVAEKRSLLPSGVVRWAGPFKKGDVVELATAADRVFGRGVITCSADEMARMAGKKTSEAAALLGYAHRGEIIHRNDLVLWG
ncbi:MAG: glutamate 5-kinase [Elusimicrobiota bacterium]